MGKHAFSFKVNGKIHSFDKPLLNGSVVEVITKNNSQAKKDWLKLMKTTHAKSKLKAQLKKPGILTSIRNSRKKQS
ncbi:MAG: bifunctional (p)ppGpp synthetase/guanosine-3',5'-bis(diphosphate) 3'-pyrophosphohydrolase [Proteobacteria bacterium]|nr:bifunctional (p)ppGpp synthetase/guanosine-3',5'-bis(diphosphate) 3'-pyrophosphohydrolase [Pseudomonadota bacterium]